jgi:hypothetical protein
MNEIEKYISENEHFLDSLKYNKSDNEIEIFFTNPNIKLSLSIKALRNLSKGKLIDDDSKFKYYNHFGFSYDNYAEFFIGNDSDYLYGLYGYNTNINLRFNIAEYHIEINSVSSLCSILLEPYYSKYLDEIADRGLEEYFYTIKIYNAPTSLHKDLLIKALYYLNSHYMRKADTFVKVYNILPKNHEALINDSDIDKEVNIKRKKTITRKDFISIEPIILFNHASTQDKENQFIGFYRILEFFFNRSLENELKKLRFDSTKSEKEIIQTIQKKDERYLLFMMLNNTLTIAEKKRIVSFLLSKSLIDKNKFEYFCNKLYEYRNSLVHAKENQIDYTKLPDIFNEFKDYQDWNAVIRLLAKKCIERLNTK